MKALVLEKAGAIQLKDMEMPVRKAGEALVKIKLCGICGTEIGGYKGNSPVVVYPVVMGHEGVGTIMEIEENNEKQLKIGDRVVLEPYTSCGECFACRQNRYNCCTHLSTCGVHRQGMMAEYIAHSLPLIHKIPESMTDEQACMVEPFTIGLHSTHRVQLQKGETCAIIGAGPIGLICGLIAQVYGGRPILIDPVEERLEIARKLGLHLTINNSKEALVPALASLTKGDMPSVLYECSGARPVLEHMHEYVSVCGRIVLLGWPHAEMDLDTANFMKKELNIYGSRNSSQCFGEAIELISSGQVDANAFISAVVEMERGQEIFDKIIKNPSEYLKVLIRVSKELPK